MEDLGEEIAGRRGGRGDVEGIEERVGGLARVVLQGEGHHAAAPLAELIRRELVLRVRRQPGVEDAPDLRMAGEVRRERVRARALTGDAKLEGPHPADREPSLARR